MTSAFFVKLLAATLCVLPQPAISAIAGGNSAPTAPAAITWRPAGAVTVPFEYFQSHIYVTVQLDGKPGYLFLLDSGANRNVLNLRTARKLGFRLPHLSQSSDAGFGAGRIYVGPQVNVDAEIDSVPVARSFAVMDLNRFEQHFHHPTDGLLGYPFFRRFVVRVDFQTRLLTLYPPKKYRYRGSGMSVPLRTSKNFVEIPVTVASGRYFRSEVDVAVDTGSNVTLVLFERFVHRMGLEDSYQRSDSGKAYGLNGYYSVKIGSIDSLQIGDMETRNTPVEYLEDREQIGPEKNLPGAIGNGILHSFRTIVFDVPKRRMFLEMNPPSSPPRLFGPQGHETFYFQDY